MWSVEVGIQRKNEGHNDHFFAAVSAPVVVAAAAAADEPASPTIFDGELADNLNRRPKPVILILILMLIQFWLGRKTLMVLLDAFLFLYKQI